MKPRAAAEQGTRGNTRKTEALRRLAIHGFDAVAGSHNFFALLEFDITRLRGLLREQRVHGDGGSLFAFLLKAIGHALALHPECNAMVNLRRTTTFGEVDIAIPVEVVVDGTRVNRQYIIRTITAQTVAEVDREIETARENREGETGFLSSRTAQRLLAALPRCIVHALFGLVLRNHQRVRELSGTVFVTSVSMFTNVPGAIIPFVGGPKASSFAIGSAMKKPMVHRGSIQIREMINITVSFNHDAVDGAPAARCINTLRRLIERDYTDLLGPATHHAPSS